ncbi:MAG: DNA recombination protein RmuC [Francisella sp.]
MVIFALLFIIFIILISIIYLLTINRKNLQINNIRKEFEQYKIDKQEELIFLKSKESTFNALLNQEKQKSIELKEESLQRIEELKSELKAERDKVSKYIEEIQLYKSQIAKLETQLTEQNNSLKEQINLLQNSEAKLKIEFENLANKIFDVSAQKITEQNQQNLNNVLEPVKEQLKDFKKKVEDVYDKESNARSALQNELKTLKELNQKMTEEAHNLTNVLKHNNKQQGIWGEMILESVLERAGLRKDFEYFREKDFIDSAGKKYRPDVVVRLPDNREIIIDAKTSLKSYIDYISADEKDKEYYLKSHINSIKEHIKKLAPKNYESLKGINSLDFVFMFIPIEGALLVALDNDKSLYDYALKNKIFLVSPSTLLVALRSVENAWRYEKQSQNIKDIYSRAETIYSKFVNFVNDLEEVGKSINNANKSYENALNKLKTGRGNLISQVDKLKRLSYIKPKKELDSSLVDRAHSNS